MDVPDDRQDSGLHDIRRLAEQHQAREEESTEARRDDLTPLGVVPPVLVMPVSTARSLPRWLALAGLGAVMGAAGLATLAYALRSNATPGVAAAAGLPETATEPAPGSAPAEPAALPVRAVVAGEAGRSQVPAAPREPAPAPSPALIAPAAAAAGGAHGGAPAGSRSERHEKRVAEARPTHAAARPAPTPAGANAAESAAPAEAEVEAPTPAPPPAPARPAPPAAPSRGEPRDELDRVLAEGTADDARNRVSGRSDDSGLPDSLSREAITQAMGRIKARVQACYEKFQQPGVVTAQVSIAPSGKVSQVGISGKFEGTETGSCVAAAVRSASFARFRGQPLSIDYPFLLQAQ
jgi:hypothetical protein